MSSANSEIPTAKKPGRGKLIRNIAIGVAASLLAAMVYFLISPDKVNLCELKDTSSREEPSVQISAIIAPTDTFVNFSSVISAAEPSVENDLGINLPKESINDAKGRQLSIVLADGVPQLAVRKTVKAEGSSDYDIREAAIPRVFKAFSLVAKCSAGALKKPKDQIETDPESDLLGALSIAADQLTADNAEKTIYVLSNGLQTAGAIKMQEPGQFPTSEKDALELADSLEGIGALPDLHGARIVWYGLGQVDGKKQKNFGQRANDSLVQFWQEVISRSNGELTTKDTYGKVGSGLPHKNAIKATPVDGGGCTIVRKLYEKDGVQFEPNTNVFVDSTKAKSAAKDVVKAFQAAHCDSITVHGFAASGTTKDEYESKKADIDTVNKALTLLRAKAFAALLKQAGFKGEISSDGFGTCEDEQWTGAGKIDETAQKQCRRVEVSN